MTNNIRGMKEEYFTEEEKTALKSGYTDDTPKTMNVVGIPALKHLSESMSCLNIENDVVKSLQLSDPGTKYKIFICCFALSVGCFIEGVDHTEDETSLSNRQHQYTAYNQYYPYLQFIIKQGANDLPELEYTFPAAAAAEEEQTHFENTVIQYVFDTVLSDKINLHNDDISDVTEMYKGIIVDKDNHDTQSLYVLFDLTLYQGLNSSFMRDGFMLASVDELVYKQKVFDTPVSENIMNLFQRYDCISLLETKNGISMPFPFQVYMCKRDDTGKYINVTKDDPNASCGYLIEHEIHGVGYFFTTEPEYIGSSTIENLQRYLCFMTDCKYILPKTDEAETVQSNSDDDNKYCSSIYFQEEGIQMWAIKNCLHFTKI